MGQVSGRVWVFLIKPGPVSGFFFFFLNPYPTLFLIGPGKTRPIRVGPGRVSAGRAKIAIPRYGGVGFVSVCLNGLEVAGGVEMEKGNGWCGKIKGE